YFRRTLRIFVPYYAFLFVVFALNRYGIFSIPSTDLISAATYTSNYDLYPDWRVSHTWSLSVEEQFYLVWPAVLALLGRRRAVIAASLTVLAVPLVRVALSRIVPALHDGIGHRFETVADALAVGCLLAACRDRLGAVRAYVAAVRAPVWVGAVAVLVLATVAFDSHPLAAYLVGWSFQGLGTAFVIDCCLRRPERLLTTVLASRPLVTIGRMSYSIYLWQELFLNRYSKALVCAFPFNLLGLAACATVSYYAIERTTMAVRGRLEARLFRARAAALPMGVAADGLQ
ncbi:MAG: acyltransferase family protein, partial [bacterium]|nr:acyltransferase family protein [bacterium]